MWARERGVNQIVCRPAGTAGKPLGSVETQRLASSPVFGPKGCCGVLCLDDQCEVWTHLAGG